MPLVSVILPNYNHSVFLDKRLKSIFNQTFKDFELIILDDCSTDNSREVIERYRFEPRVSQIVYNDVNNGSTFEQWNKGIALATGEFIWIAESDDFCEPGFLQELVAPLQSHPDLVMSFCQTLFVSPEGKIIAKTSVKNLAEYISGTDFLSRHMLGNNGIPNVSMLVFRKATLAMVSADYKKMKYCGDWLLYSSLSLFGKVYISGRYLNYYLRHKETVTSVAVKLGYDFIEGNQIFKFIRSNVPVQDNDILSALNERIDRYFQVKSDFQNEEVNTRVLESLMALDTRMKSLFQKRARSTSLRKYISRIKNLVFR